MKHLDTTYPTVPGHNKSSTGGGGGGYGGADGNDGTAAAAAVAAGCVAVMLYWLSPN